MNELAAFQKNELAVASENNGIGELLKPLIQEIHLFDTYIAGTSHIPDQKIFESVHINDKLDLCREDNKFDENAILVNTQSGKKLGYVPRCDNIIFARLMNAGKMLSAKISDIELIDKWYKISIGIYLVDF